MSKYQFRWKIRTSNSTQRARVQAVTLDGLMTSESIYVCEGDMVSIAGPFGTDLCVVGGWAEIEHITNDYPDDPLTYSTPVYYMTQDCHGNLIDHGDQPES